jgi:hypothetical protein
MLPDQVRQFESQITQKLDDKFGQENVDRAARILESTAVGALVATNPALNALKTSIELSTGRDLIDGHQLSDREKFDRAISAIPVVGQVYTVEKSALELVTGRSLVDGHQLSGVEQVFGGIAVVGAALPAATQVLSNGNSAFTAAAEASGVSRALSQEEQIAANTAQQATRAEQGAASAAGQAANAEQGAASAAQQAQLPGPNANQLLLPAGNPKLVDAPISNDALAHVKPDYQPNLLNGEPVVPRGTAPESVYTPEYIDQHAQRYENGASFMMPQEDYNRYAANGYLGRPGEGQFAVPSGEMTQMQQSMTKEQLAQKLGVTWDPSKPWVRVDVPPSVLQDISNGGPIVRLPNGSESGAGTLFNSGGYTVQGVTEGLINEVPVNQLPPPTSF